MTLQFSCTRFATIADVYAAECGCALDSPADDGLLEAVLDIASDMLAILSGLRVHGICTRTVRPVGDGGCFRIGDSSTDYISGPWYLQGTIPLRGPNTDIVEVLIDGAPVPLSEYGLIENRYLQRHASPWPASNDITKDDSQVGTWSVTYRFGRAPDFLTKQATIELACELAASALGNDTGHLPPGVTSANIQGASVSLTDRAEALRNGDGEQIPAISRFLGVYAPDGPGRSSVWSPELNLGIDLLEVEGPSGS